MTGTKFFNSSSERMRGKAPIQKIFSVNLRTVQISCLTDFPASSLSHFTATGSLIGPELNIERPKSLSDHNLQSYDITASDQSHTVTVLLLH